MGNGLLLLYLILGFVIAVVLTKKFHCEVGYPAVYEDNVEKGLAGAMYLIGFIVVWFGWIMIVPTLLFFGVLAIIGYGFTNLLEKINNPND